jgi:predicted DNA binding protein
MLLTAYALGYYDVPRRISSDDLSRHLDVDKSTIVEHLRKAERKIIASIVAG